MGKCVGEHFKVFYIEVGVLELLTIFFSILSVYKARLGKNTPNPACSRIIALQVGGGGGELTIL